MLKKLQEKAKKALFQCRAFLIAKISKIFLHLIAKTCKIELEGINQFHELAKKERCILMLWHNRLALSLFILSQYTPSITYSALVSASKDGDLLCKIIHSYQNGKTIRVPHHSRHQALREVVHHIQEQKSIVIITPDGPRGPRYEVKPGIALAALKTDAHVVPLNWEANRYWELKTWDRLRLPKPFATIRVSFHPPLRFDLTTSLSLEEAQSMLKTKLPAF